MNLKEDIQVHETLNPKLWDGMYLKEEVAQKIIDIAAAFEKYVSFPIKIVDIHLVGSNASYNYTENSDIDVHLIVNFEATTSDESALKALCDAKKSSFNAKYNITIKGCEVEIYVQDINSITCSNGIYSIGESKWIKEPKHLSSVKNHDVSEEFYKWQSRIAAALKRDELEELSELLSILYLIRHNSLSVDGEFGKGNQLFKKIRSEGYVKLLKDALDKKVEKSLTLEGYSKGELVNRMDFK